MQKRRHRRTIAGSAWHRLRRDVVLESRPFHVFTELTTSCNLRCVMCPRTAATDSLEGLDMPVEVLRRLDSELFPDAVLVELNGVGDSPLMKRWGEVLEVIERHAFVPLLTTNGLMLDERTVEVFARREGILRISIDGATRGTYEAVRVNGDFDQLRRKLALVREVRARHADSGMTVEFSFVAMRRNIRELPALVELAREFGVDEILVQNMVAVLPEHQAWSLTHTPVLANYLFVRAKLLAERYGIHLYLPPLFDAPGADRKRSWLGSLEPRTLRTDRILKKGLAPGAVLCPEPWMTMNVQRDGTVTPCCVSAQPMGSIHREPLRAIWNNEEYRQIRKELSGQAPLRNPTCRNCHFLRGNARAALFKEDPEVLRERVRALQATLADKDRHIQNIESVLRENYIEL
ncbi:MAG: radical SAM protein [Planctomycetales bacterium]|nr:radical SAM protein [Planctomycetales bacterium]